MVIPPLLGHSISVMRRIVGGFTLNKTNNKHKVNKTIKVSVEELQNALQHVTSLLADKDLTENIIEKVIMAELMNVPTHGLHYYIHALHPLLRQKKINTGTVSVDRTSVFCNGNGGIGFLKLDEVLSVASDVAINYGLAIALIREPGKVGALRVYCEKFMNNNQMVMIFKNTARTVGVSATGEPVIGTNPICIGLPGTRFIYDSSISTVATNKLRLAEKYSECFPYAIGLDQDMIQTNQPEKITANGGFLSPFSEGPFWFKSFYLGVAIEALAAFAGGKTSHRVGEHKGKRLYSKEGLFALIVDSSATPVYEEYIEEVSKMLLELRKYNIRIPNDYNSNKKEVELLKDDWEELNNL